MADISKEVYDAIEDECQWLVDLMKRKTWKSGTYYLLTTSRIIHESVPHDPKQIVKEWHITTKAEYKKMITEAKQLDNGHK